MTIKGRIIIDEPYDIVRYLHYGASREEIEEVLYDYSRGELIDLIFKGAGVE